MGSDPRVAIVTGASRELGAEMAVSLGRSGAAVVVAHHGEVPLAEGVNEIEIEAVLNDGRRTSQKLAVTWVDTKPRKALQARLAALREENAALVEQLREKLAREVRTARSREQRDLEISVAK